MQRARAHHRCQGERDHRGDDDGDCQRHGEFAEEPAHYVAHEQQGNEYGHQRNGQRHNGEADLLGALERSFQGWIARFEVPRNIFDHHNGVVHHESGGDGERHHG